VSEPTSPRPLVGDWNHLESSVGARGMGKSTHQAYRALQLSRQAGGAYVIGHSLGARLPKRLPKELGGEVLPIEYHPTLEKLERGLRRRPNKWHILAPELDRKDDNTDTADDMLRYAVRLSTQIRKQAWKRKHPFGFWKPNVDMSDVAAVPVIVLIDEGIAIESAGQSRKESNRWFLEFLYSLRHYHIGLLYSIQDASARSWRVLEQSTAIHVFAVRHEWALNSIRAAGASDEEIQKIERLTKYHHVTLSWDSPQINKIDSGTPEADSTEANHLDSPGDKAT
jgi:hypothetical protein